MARRRHRQLRRRRMARGRIRGPLQAETLEPRLVLASLLDASQVAALAQGITVFADRMDQIAESGLLGQEAAALGQPIGTLVPLGDELRVGFVDRIVGLSGVKTPAEIVTILATAAGTSVSQVSEMLGTDERIWFSVPLSRTTTLPSYELNLGQQPGDGAAASLSDQGLRLGTVPVSLTAGIEGTVSFGVNLAAGLAAEQALSIKFDTLRAFGRASHTGKSAIADVDAEYGVLRLGPADLDVTIDSGVTLDLQGRLPDPATTHKFLADTSPGKREIGRAHV